MKKLLLSLLLISACIGLLSCTQSRNEQGGASSSFVGGIFSHTVTCERCDGSGTITYTCPNCEGEGKVEE